jgi:hypothetical protein
MSQVWHRMRGLANPIPAVEPGGVEQNEWDPGGDVLLPDDSFSRLHNPQNGRVPPQLPAAVQRPRWPEFPLTQYARHFVNTPVALSAQLAFQAQSVRIDNYSSHWIHVRASGVYIPPFVYGTVILLDPGVSVAEYVLAAPLGHADSATVESLVLSIWYECAQVPVTGFSVPAT